MTSPWTRLVLDEARKTCSIPVGYGIEELEVPLSKLVQSVQTLLAVNDF